MSIGGKLKELRILKGLTQEELADRAELSKGFISQVERDLTSPSIATLMDILQCLGTTIGEFFNEAPEEQIVFEKNDYFIKEDPELKNEIPEDTFFHMTDLADKLLAENRHVGMYPISEDSFLDMGEFEEMHRMEEKLNLKSE